MPISIFPKARFNFDAGTLYFLFSRMSLSENRFPLFRDML
ncbi:hypothetical protein CEV33_0866 [Brucella grignonensis]|uniref:Uncharacterized protein n=1 Tax=Brucella grignonensis TaxID=94627 RepID=A0A256FE44_9HYPH|nr:hypothetical protein CEV33_0866 [Brucella grignonensis]